MKRPREYTYHFPFHCDKLYNHFHFLSKLGRCVKRLRVNTYHFLFHCDQFITFNHISLEIRDSLTQNKWEMCKKTEGKYISLSLSSDKLNHFHLLNNLTLERDPLTQNKREMCKKTEGFPGEIYSDSLQ